MQLNIVAGNSGGKHGGSTYHSVKGEKKMEGIEAMVEGLCRYIGQTVTVFTTSGGLSGEGFTGILLSADCRAVRLLSDMGAAPACPIGSACSNGGWGFNNNGGNCGFRGGNPFGSVAIIPTRCIAAFVHNAI